MSRVTAIIPTLIDVDGEYLKLCVSSLRESGFDGDIIAIANGTKDMQPFRDMEPGITKAITVKRQGQCFAVNQGAQMAEGDCKYLFVINADMYFAPGWDKSLDWDNLPSLCCSPNLVEPTNNPGSAAPFRKLDAGFTLEEFDQEKVNQYIASSTDIDPAERMGEPNEEAGFNLPFIIDIDLWRTIEGYDEFYDPWGSSSDTDLQMKIELAGVKPVRLRDALVYHFSNKSGTFDGTHQQEWWDNWNYLENKWGFNRDEAKSDTWYCKDMIIWDKLKYKPDWMNKYDSES